MTPPPLLLTIVRTATEATAAAEGWLLRADGDELCVVAGHPLQALSDLVGQRAPAGSGVAGYAIASAQPLALSLRDDEARFAGGLESRRGRMPESIVCVPCEAEGVIVGALQLVDKPGGSFSYDDVEVATLLGTIAGSALAEGGTAVAPPSPAYFEAELGQLRGTEPSRYATVASILEALLAYG